MSLEIKNNHYINNTGKTNILRTNIFPFGDAPVIKIYKNKYIIFNTSDFE